MARLSCAATGNVLRRPGFRPYLLAAAYELQDAVAKLRIASGDRLIGYKVGCTGPGTTQQFGMKGRSEAASSRARSGGTARL